MKQQAENKKYLDLVNFVTSENKICPKPKYWNQLWEMLPKKTQLPEGGWEPPLPLILAAWQHSTGLEKRERLIAHINYAQKNKVLNQVDQFLRALTEDNWESIT